MIKKLRCEYPACNKEGDHRHIIKLVNELNASVDLPFCKYHYFIIIGGHFEARIHNKAQNLLGETKETSFELIGPLLEIEIVEQVMGAREMILKSKKAKVSGSQKTENSEDKS